MFLTGTAVPSKVAGEERTLLAGAVVVRVAALFWGMLCGHFVDCTVVAGVRVFPSRAGRVTLTFMEGPSLEGAAGRRTDDVEVPPMDGLSADELGETKRRPNLAFAEGSLEYPEGTMGPLRRVPSPPGPGRRLAIDF
jgi:hypothetical protein